MKTMGALLWEPGTNSGWTVDEIELDPPKFQEVRVKLAASGICHSDDHVDTGDIPLDWAPILGGHEGAGVIEEVGPGVTDFEVGDHVVLAFIPSCRHCAMCTVGKPSLCTRGAGLLGGYAPDGTHRIHSHGKGVGAYSYLGTFAPYVVASVDSCIKIDKDIPLDKAALVGCGVPTGWGSSVYAGGVSMGDTVIVVGTGGVGMNAVQGARLKGAKNILTIDPVDFKQEVAKKFGATHSVKDFSEARDVVDRWTNGQGADVVIVTVGVAYGKIINPAQELTRVGGTLVVTAAAPVNQRDVPFDLYTFAMSGKRLQGSLYGTCIARRDVPIILDLYRNGDLLLDELVTRTYKLEDINTAFQDLRAGSNIRGVIMYD